MLLDRVKTIHNSHLLHENIIERGEEDFNPTLSNSPTVTT